MNTDETILGCVVRQAGHYRRRRGPRWSVVAELCAVGSTAAHELCRRFGVDPDEKVGGPRCGCEAPAGCYRDGDVNSYRCGAHCDHEGDCEEIPQDERATP